jgi:autophagy-related protein 2
MAFFAAFSSSIGKRLLLFGLRHIDILDKDPADFVSVEVGKETTLEVRDVGLHVKKLVALLHLKLPPEIELSTAKASLLRVTFVLDFGVPQIIIKVDGVQVHARLVEDKGTTGSKPRGKEPTPPRSRTTARSPPPQRFASSPALADDASDASSDTDDEHVPTVDDLAQSFIREEPAQEIRELEEALNTQSEYMQESVSSSSDGDEDGISGVGAPLGLPGVLRNLLNTALDRLHIVANHIDIQVEDHSLLEPSSDNEEPSVSLNFHVDRIAIDSVTTQEPRVEIGSSTVPKDHSSKLGKRRMRLENIYARLISDADSFASMSRVSQSSSPVDARSDLSSRKAPSEASSSQLPASTGALEPTDEAIPPLRASQVSFASRHEAVQSQAPSSPPVPSRLMTSIHTVDEDRFADAASDGGLDHSQMEEHMSQSQQSFAPPSLSASSILYDDAGLLDYALENSMLESGISESSDDRRFNDSSGSWRGHGVSSNNEMGLQGTASELSTSGLPSVSALGLSVTSNHSLPQTTLPSTLTASIDSPDPAVGEFFDPPSPAMSVQESPPSEQSDMNESKLFTHDDAESMYMSAMSAAPAASSRGPVVPGSWDSSSTSSQETGSDTSAPIPDAMIAGSILVPAVETEDGTETPRPGTPQSAFASPQKDMDASSTQDPRSGHDMDAGDEARLAKSFLTIDQVNVWFPLGLDAEQSTTQIPPQTMEHSDISFSPPNVGQDSIFQEMPGSFSNYAHSTSSRTRVPVDLSATPNRRPQTSTSSVTPPTTASKGSLAGMSVEVGSMVGHMDVSTGRIMFQMFKRVVEALTGSEIDEIPSQKKPPESQTSSHSSIELSIKSLSIAWLEQLMTESFVAGAAPRYPLEPKPVEAIIRLHLGSIRIASRSKPGEAHVKLCIETFVLASLDHDIISFQRPKPRSRRSLGSSTDQLRNDVEVDYEQAKERRVTVVTRPVKVSLDMAKLDEALGSFGGFSGILELGNSISSGSTLHSPVISGAPPRSRGVHFGDTPVSPPTTSVPNVLKIHVQLGEVTFILRGKSCSVQLQSTSVRAAIRGNNVRLKISEVQFSGPYADASRGGAPLLVDVKGTTIEFLFAPTEADLAKLISMITPSKDPYENDEDILIDTLLRQRRKGSVLRAEVESVEVRVLDLAQLKTFEALGMEMARLAKVTKYLPDDDRPGVLTLASVRNFDVIATINDKLGDVALSLKDISLAHVGVPALFAIQIEQAYANRGEEVLVHEVVKLRQEDRLPMIMARVIGDEMEPVIKVKLFNLCAEYHVSAVMAALGIEEHGTGEDIALGLASSVATITGASSPKTLSRHTTASSSPSTTSSKPLHIDILFRSCAIGLNPRKLASKGLFVLTESHFLGKQAKKDKYGVSFELRQASFHAIDNVSRISDRELPRAPTSNTDIGYRQLLELREYGYVSLSSISAAKVLIDIVGDGKEKPQTVDIEFKNDLFVLQSCADSTQTLIAILNGLQPPIPPSTAQKYRTVVPLQEMMESFTGDAFAPEDVDDDVHMDNADLVDDEVPANLEFVGSIYNAESLPSEEELGDSLLSEDDLSALATPPVVRQRGEQPLLESFQEQYEVTEGEQDFDFDNNYFHDSDSDGKGKARKWDSRKNQYHLTNEFKVPNAPLKLRVRDMNIVWDLFDGYDWPRTRDIITQAVDDVEARAEERRQQPQDEDEEEDFVEQDFLFNSVWIGVPIKDEKGALAKRINHDIDDLVSETGSYATSTATRSTGATIRPRSATKVKGRKLKLERSKTKKIAFKISSVAVDLIVFPPSTGETQNSTNVRVQDFEIIDHVPTSTWKKFLTSLIEPSKREMGRPMIELEVLNTKPVDDLAASELVIKVNVLPLRLHVDQDALDFVTRFFEFKDDTVPESDKPPEQPFIQRLEVMAVQLKLDYKPKRVDYRGIRSGHTTEFMNFLILDGADITLRHAIVYGITSFDKLNKTLNDVWMPDVRRNQLPGVLSGLAAVRPIVNVGSGVRDLVVVPMREYKKDGRIVRSLQKGVYAFAKNTTSEVARLGAKVAIGTQTLLEGAETFLIPQSGSPRSPSTLHDWDDVDPNEGGEDEPRAVSNYANQPIGVKAGLRSAARYLERDLLTARDAIIAIPGEVMEEGTGIGMAKAIARRAPTVILRPALGATKAVSHALLGVGNALDKDSRRKIEDVSSHTFGGCLYTILMMSRNINPISLAVTTSRHDTRIFGMVGLGAICIRV